MKPHHRKKLLSKVHIGKAQLGLDDPSYRAILQRVAGVTSAAQLKPHGFNAVLAEMQRLGFQQTDPKQKSHGKPHNFASPAMPEMITKIEALLADMQLPWAYADAIAKQQTGIAKVAWVTQPQQLKGIIAALYNKQKRDNQK